MSTKPEYQPDPAPAVIGSAGDGPTSVMVMHDRAMVVLKFPTPKLWVSFDVTGARNVADAMHAEADLISHLITRQDRMAAAANRMRDQLITRVTIMLTSMERDRKKPAYQAAHVVDQVLQAVSELASR